jgi:hypothetical protein
MRVPEKPPQIGPQRRFRFGKPSSWQDACHCFLDHVAIATTIHFGVHNPEDTNRNASCDKALHLEIPAIVKSVASLSKKSPHLESVVEVDRRGAKWGVSHRRRSVDRSKMQL